MFDDIFGFIDLDLIITVMVMFGLLIGGAFALNSCLKEADIADLEAWNGGYHEDCGGRWEYEQAIGHRYDTNYIYVCDKCGMLHEFENFRVVEDGNDD